MSTAITASDSPARRALHGVRRWRPSVVLATGVLVVAIAWALLPGLLAPHEPLTSVGPARTGPSLAHVFGTDAIGRDLFSRVIHGASRSLTGALLAVGVGLMVGTALGVLAGSSVRFVDDLIMRLVDVLLAIPQLLLMLSVLVLLGFGTTNAAIAVGISSVAAFARLARSEVVRVRRTDYVEAAFGSGGRFLTVLWRHVLPNSAGPVVALAALQFGIAIIALSTLSFLGYGAPPPQPEWGLLIAEGRDHLATSWWMTTLPGLVLVAVVVSANRVSMALRRQR